MSKAASRASRNEAMITGSISPEQAVHEEQQEAETPRARPVLSERFKIKKRLTLPSLVIKPGVTMYLRIDTPITVSTVIDPAKPNQPPAHVCQVTDLETGEAFVLLVNKVIEGNLNEGYPSNDEGQAGYVGMSFAFSNLGKRRGKQHFDFEISEVEANDE